MTKHPPHKESQAAGLVNPITLSHPSSSDHHAFTGRTFRHSAMTGLAATRSNTAFSFGYLAKELGK